MKHIKTLNNKTLKESMKKGGCGECQTSCQSACKTSCTVGNQSCEKCEPVILSGRGTFEYSKNRKRPLWSRIVGVFRYEQDFCCVWRKKENICDSSI